MILHFGGDDDDDDDEKEDDEEEELKMKVAHLTSLLGQGGYTASTLELVVLVLTMTMMLMGKRRMQMSRIFDESTLVPLPDPIATPPKTEDSLIAWPQKV